MVVRRRRGRIARRIASTVATLLVVATGLGGAAARTAHASAATQLVYAITEHGFSRIDPVSLDVLASGGNLYPPHYVLSPDRTRLALPLGDRLVLVDAITLQQLGSIALRHARDQWWSWPVANRLVGLRSRGGFCGHTTEYSVYPVFCWSPLDATVVDAVHLTSRIVRVVGRRPGDLQTWAGNGTPNGAFFIGDSGAGTRFRLVAATAKGVRTTTLRIASGAEDSRVLTIPPELARAARAVRSTEGPRGRMLKARAGWWLDEPPCDGPVPPYAYRNEPSEPYVVHAFPGYRILFARSATAILDLVFDLDDGSVTYCDERTSSHGFDVLHHRRWGWSATAEAIAADPEHRRVFVVTPRVLATYDNVRRTVSYRPLRGSLGQRPVRLVARWAGDGMLAVQGTSPASNTPEPSVVSLLDVRTGTVRQLERTALQSVAVSDGMILVSSLSGLRAYNDRGDLVWWDFRETRAFAVVVGDYAYANGWSCQPTYVVDARTGSVVNTIGKRDCSVNILTPYE
jgi:hypothetical protein